MYKLWIVNKIIITSYIRISRYVNFGVYVSECMVKAKSLIAKGNGL